MTESKVCTLCKTDKPLDEYYMKSTGRPMPRCKACQKAYQLRYAALNPERVLDNARRTRAANKSAIAERRRAKRQADPEAARAADRAADAKRADARKAYRAATAERRLEIGAVYRATNREALRAAAAAYRAERKDILAARQRAWRVANPVAYVAIHSLWKRANKAMVNAATHRRRALMRGCAVNYTAAEWEALKEATGRVCLCCGEAEPDILLCVDHVMPVSKGGGNGIDNIQPLCFSRNSTKYTKSTDYRS